jgi:hypothetical protein
MIVINRDYKNDVTKVLEDVTGIKDQSDDAEYEDLFFYCTEPNALSLDEFGQIVNAIVSVTDYIRSVSFVIKGQAFGSLFSNKNIMQDLSKVPIISLEMVECEIGLFDNAFRLNSSSLETLILSDNKISDRWLDMLCSNSKKLNPEFSTLEIGNNKDVSDKGLKSCLDNFKMLKTLNVQKTGIKTIPVLPYCLDTIDLSETTLD